MHWEFNLETTKTDIINISNLFNINISKISNKERKKLFNDAKFTFNMFPEGTNKCGG